LKKIGGINMGIGIQALNLTLTLYKDQLFDGFKSVIELGSQDISGTIPGLETVGVLSQALGIVPPKNPDAINPEWFYENIGFKKYNCIDMDGMHNALVFNLNEDLVSKYGFIEKYDLVTNHGTTEHCFNQYNAFRNIHNLCAKGGIMIHALPFQGYLNHGFFNYQPVFYYDLAAANNYQIIGIYLNIDASVGDISTYSDELMKFIKMDSDTTAALFVVMRKMNDQEFRIPYDEKYFPQEENQKINFTKTPVRYFPIDRFTIDPKKLANHISMTSLTGIYLNSIHIRYKGWIKGVIRGWKNRIRKI